MDAPMYPIGHIWVGWIYWSKLGQMDGSDWFQSPGGIRSRCLREFTGRRLVVLLWVVLTGVVVKSLFVINEVFSLEKYHVSFAFRRIID